MAKLSEDSWAALYQAQLSRYQTIFDADHNMDAKGGVLIGATLAVSVFVLSKSLFETTNKLIYAMLILGCLAFAFALYKILLAIRPQDYSLPAHSTEEQPDYLEKDDEGLLYQLVVDCEDATISIETNLKQKAVLITDATTLFIIGSVDLLVVKLFVG